MRRCEFTNGCEVGVNRPSCLSPSMPLVQRLMWRSSRSPFLPCLLSTEESKYVDNGDEAHVLPHKRKVLPRPQSILKTSTAQYVPHCDAWSAQQLHAWTKNSILYGVAVTGLSSSCFPHPL